MNTFSQTFVPRQQQSVIPPAAFIPIESRFDTTAQREAALQVEHFKLWSYVAIDRNSTKAGESSPIVGRIERRSSPRRTQRQKFLTEFYPGLIRNELDDAVPVDDSHPLATLLETVNGTDWWSSFAYETYMFFQLTGSFVWWVIPNGAGLPAELWNIPPQWAKPEYSRSGDLVHWKITPHGEQRYEFLLPPEEVIRGMKKNPLSKIKPLAPSEAGAEWILNSEAIERARHLAYKHGNLQNLVLQLSPEHFADTTPELLEQVAGKFMARYAGVERSYRPIVSPPGVTPTPINLKPSEMLLNEVSDQIRDFVLSLYGTPKAVVGLSHDLNKASIYGANLIWCEHTIQPMQRFLAGCLTEKLAKRFDPSLVVWFDDCRPHDEESERAEWELDWKMQSVTPDERRLYRGREPLAQPWSETPYGPMSSVPLAIEPEEKTTESQSVQRQGAVRLGKRERRVLTAFRRLHKAAEKAALRDLRQFWDVIIRHAEKNMQGDSVPLVSKIVVEKFFREKFNAAMRRHWAQMVVSGADLEASAIGAQRQNKELPDISVEYPEELKKDIATFLKQRQDGIWKRVLSTTHASMEVAIQGALEEGLHVREIRDRVLASLKTSKEHATVIARTEATASLNYGQQAMRDAEDVPHKIWIATVDGKTRDTHVLVDQQIVPNDQPFRVGEYAMMFPGDGSLGAPAEEIVMCRCTSSGVVDD